jgi:hypothetical protein
MGAPRWILRTALAVCAVMCALPAHALASATEQSVLMDDDQLIYATPDHMMSTLEQLKALGVDRVKVSVVWLVVAPSPNSTRVPRFDAANPAAYPAGAWDRYDDLVRDAQQLGIDVYFQITPPSPAWAVARGKPAEGYPWSYRPSAREFGKFVEAVARRYSGSYVPQAGATPLPRVNYWGIWNEPNEGAWLNPQWRTVGRGGRVLIAPLLYRQLVDAAYGALRATGHAHDTILIGETASRGWIFPIQFVEALYCVNSHNRPLVGTAATNLGCPRSGSRSQFAARHPGLFASEYAHHPYSFDTPPNRIIAPGLITLANLGVLERTLNRIFATYGKHPRGGVPMYLTEWGYKSNPPNPFVKTSLTEQATWLNQGEYMTWKDSYVRALDQFLLVDDKPRAGAKKGSLAYWSTFQSGLLFANGSQKPAYAAFRIPIWLPSASHAHLTVWGELRPANHSTLQTAELQYQRRESRSWTNARVIQTSNKEGFLLAHLSVPGAGNVRLAWTDTTTGAVYYSRAATVR